MQFTDKLIKSLKPKLARYDVREKNGTGFVIRIFPSGQKSWGFIYHFAGIKKRMTFGVYPQLSLAEARKIHSEASILLANGKDPSVIKRKKLLETKNSETIHDLMAEFLEKWSKPRKRSWREDERILKKDIMPIWGKQKAKDITKRDVLLLLDKIINRGSPISANRTLAVVRRMFNFGIEQDIIISNPAHAVKAPAKENRRDRLLSLDEINIFWNKINQAGMSDLSKFALKLQLTTAQRKGEVISAEWSDMNLNLGWWTIPACKAKNNTLHRVPLSELSILLLNNLKNITGHSQWLFPSPTGKSHIAGGAIDHALRKNLALFDGIDNGFTPHDLRRTTASHMTALGVSRLVVSKILNHAENSVTAIYDRHSYDTEKKQALDLWAKKLNEIIG